MIGSLFSSLFGIQANKIPEQSIVISEQLQPVILSKLQGIEWVKKCTAQYPEIHWLADMEVRKADFPSRLP